MKVLHLNSGNETGGGMFHILSLLHQLNKKINVTLGLFHDMEMAERARNMGIQVQIFKQNSKFDLSVLKEIQNFIQKNEIDILHSHGPRANFISYLIRHNITCQWLITVHSDPEDDFIGKGILGRLFTHLNIKSIKNADHILAISNRFKDKLMTFGIEANKISTILNGIDFHVKPRKIYKRSDFGLNENDFVIMQIARLDPVKNHKTAFKALKQLLDKSTEFQLVLVGDGALENDLKNLAKEMNISENVHFLGYRNDIPELLTLCDITILTSRSESFPLVLLESARAKKPVISTDVGDVKSLIPDDRYGFIINVDDYNDLTKKIWKMYQLRKSGMLTIIGENLHRHAAANFSEEHFAKSVLMVYKKVV